MLLVVMVGWVFFNARTLSQAVDYLSVMAGLRHGTGLEYPLSLYINPALVLALLAGIVGSMPIVPFLRKSWERALCECRRW